MSSYLQVTLISNWSKQILVENILTQILLTLLTSIALAILRKNIIVDGFSLGELLCKLSIYTLKSAWSMDYEKKQKQKTKKNKEPIFSILSQYKILFPFFRGLIDQNNILHILNNNSRTAWPTELLMPILRFSENCARMLIFPSKKMLIILR